MIEIYSIGYEYRHKPGFVIDRPNGLPYYNFLLFRSKAYIRFAEENIIIDPPAIVIIKRWQGQHWGGYADEIYVEDWICFICGDDNISDGENEIELMFKELNIPFNTLLYSDNIYTLSNIIKDLEHEYFKKNKYRDELLDLKIRTLFYELAENIYHDKKSLKTTNRHMKDFQDIRNNIYKLHGLDISVSELAKQINMSVSHFKLMYKKIFGVSPGRDIIKSRLEYACNLLRFENLSVANIAERCHYSGPEHFIRQFRQYMNCSPGEYRKSKNR